MNINDRKYKDKNRGKKRAIIFILLLIIILLLLLLWGILKEDMRNPFAPVRPTIPSHTADTTYNDIEMDSSDTNNVSDTSDTLKNRIGSTSPTGQGKTITGSQTATENMDTTAKEAYNSFSTDSFKSVSDLDAAAGIGADSADSTAGNVSGGPCESDSVSPWIYPEPSGGLHYGSVNVRLISDESCMIHFRLDKEAEWRLYDNTPILIDKKRVLHFMAKDTCGNEMAPRKETYEIKPPPSRKYCPDDMVFIEIGETRFCIDRYEWPNKGGKRPRSFISIYHARDSCFTVGKRLCSTEEWSLACGGVYGWKYSYGDVYEPNACNTRDTTAYASGSKPECRGYFGVFDMNGNLAEWTDTRSKRNNRFYNVMGGFWDSGSQSDCFSTRYSYFPQNKHNPVGFRCCKSSSE